MSKESNSDSQVFKPSNYASTIKIPIAIRVQGRQVTLEALVDSGATSCFINPRVIQDYWLPTIKKDQPVDIYVIDGREIESGKITLEVQGQLLIGTHQRNYTFEVTDIGHHDMVLGMTWLKKENPQIDWVKETITMPSFNHELQATFSKSAQIASKEVKEEIPIEQLVPQEYHEYLHVFDEKEANKVPPHREYDLAIDLEEDAKLKLGPIYALTLEEEAEMKRYIDDMLSKGFIRH